MVREWIRDHDLSKILWRIICVIILFFAFNIKIVNLSTEQSAKILSAKRKNYTKELTDYELSEFIKLYPKFKEDIIFQDKDVDYIAEYPDSADWVTKRWFIYQAWDAKRFFYVQKRIQEALGIIQERKKSAGFIDQLKKRVAEKSTDAENKTPDSDLIISTQMLELHQKKADDTGDFTLDELALVEKRAEEIKGLFE